MTESIVRKLKSKNGGGVVRLVIHVQYPARKHPTSFSPSILLSLLCSSQLVSHSFLLSTHFLLNACHREKQRQCHSMKSNQGRMVGRTLIRSSTDGGGTNACHSCQVRQILFHTIRIPYQTSLQLTRRIASSSSAPAYLKGMRWRSMSEKYSFASFPVLVPRPL